MLAICTAFKKAYIAVEIDGNIKCTTFDGNCKHSENLLVEIEKLLGDKTVSDLKEICAVVGPGSFTGIRIGVSTALGLLASNTSIHAKKLSSLDFIAACYLKENNPDGNFYTVLDGLSGFYFIKEFDISGKAISDEKMIEKTEYEKIFNSTVGIFEESVAAKNIEPEAGILLDLAKDAKDIKISELRPVYIRLSQAEANLGKMHD